MTTRYATCETVTAGPMAPNHLRVLERGEDLRTTGISADRYAFTLCGRDLTAGWDLQEPDEPTIRALAAPRPGDGHVWLCSTCEDAWRTRAVDTARRKGHEVRYDVAYDDYGNAASWSVRVCDCETPWRHS